MTGDTGSETRNSDAGETTDVVDTRDFEIADDEPQEEQTPEEAEASFEAGFSNVASKKDAPAATPEPPESKAKAEEPKELKEKPEPEPEPQETPEPTLEAEALPTPEEHKSLQKRVRRAEGQLGELKAALKAQAAKAETTKAEQQAIRGELKKIAELEESAQEFKELVPFKEELQSFADEIANIKGRLEARSGDAGLTPEIIDTRVNEALLEFAHPDWEEKSRSPEFRRFALQGGPSEEDYAQYARLDNSGSQEERARAKEILADWEIDYPGWWKTKAKGLFSSKATDSISLLDQFEDARAAANRQRSHHENQSARRRQRLRANVTPQGVASDPVTGLTDDEAFKRGFLNARGR